VFQRSGFQKTDDNCSPKMNRNNPVRGSRPLRVRARNAGSQSFLNPFNMPLPQPNVIVILREGSDDHRNEHSTRVIPRQSPPASVNRVLSNVSSCNSPSSTMVKRSPAVHGGYRSPPSSNIIASRIQGPSHFQRAVQSLAVHQPLITSPTFGARSVYM
jgi:hypothetical protein